MAFNQDTDLKEAIIKNLDENGILAKLQAQLKAAVFVSLESHEAAKKLNAQNEHLNNFVSTQYGITTLSLVADTLKSLGLISTLSVFEAEISSKNQKSLMERAKLIKELKYSDSEMIDRSPIIHHVLDEYFKKSSSPNNNFVVSEKLHSPYTLSESSEKKSISSTVLFQRSKSSDYMKRESPTYPHSSIQENSDIDDLDEEELVSIRSIASNHTLNGNKLVIVKDVSPGINDGFNKNSVYKEVISPSINGGKL